MNIRTFVDRQNRIELLCSWAVPDMDAVIAAMQIEAWFTHLPLDREAAVRPPPLTLQWLETGLALRHTR